MRIPTPEQVGQVLTAAEDWFAPFVALAAFAGLRIGEASAVQVRDIDFLRRTLHVQRQVQNGPTGVEVSAPKYGSERKVYLPDALVTLLAQHIERVGVHGDDGWLFPGVPTSPRNMRRAFDRTCERVGLDLIPHDLRHFYASGLIAAGCDVVTVQRALGHAKATTTLNTYGHLWPTAEDRTRVAAADLMSTALDARGDQLGTAEG